jgi:hypothetical protein
METDHHLFIEQWEFAFWEINPFYAFNFPKGANRSIVGT